MGQMENSTHVPPQRMSVTFCNVMELMMLDVAAVGSSNDN